MFTFDQAKVVRYQAGALARLGDLRGAHIAFDAVPATFSAPKPRALMRIEHAAKQRRVPVTVIWPDGASRD